MPANASQPRRKQPHQSANQLPRLDSIVRGDCLQSLRLLADESIDLTVFSPPYDAIRNYSGAWTLNHADLGDQLLRVTKDGGVAAVVLGDGTRNFAKSMTTFRWAVDWVDRAGWRLFECCIYGRHGNPGAWWAQRFRVDHEYILLFLKGARPRRFNKEPLMVSTKHAGRIYSGTDRLTNGGFKKIEPKAVHAKKCRGTLWQYATSNTEGNRLKLQHPATFPDQLAEDLILCFSAPGDTVLDPMVGSGTTAVMALRNDRRFLGMEISAEYCDLAEQRIRTELERRKGLLL